MGWVCFDVVIARWKRRPASERSGLFRRGALRSFTRRTRRRRTRTLTLGRRRDGAFQAPQHFLYLRPEPQEHGSLRPTFGAVRTGTAPAGGGLFFCCQ